MARKKKPKSFRAVKVIKALAREKVGAPPATRREEDSRKSGREKHKSTLSKLLSETQ